MQYFKPHHYALELFVFRKDEETKGKVIISGEVMEDTDVVKIHAVDMVIKGVKYSADSWCGSPEGDQPEDCAYKYDAKTITIPITLEMKRQFLRQSALNYEEDYDDRLTVSFYIEFETKLNKNMQGCYLSTYEWEGKEQRVVATQFESHYAREAFPCIDEPAAKATFSLTLLDPDHEEKDIVIANTPLKYRDCNRFHFETTPKMSTYLLAWVIGPFQSVTNVNKNGVRVSSYCALNQDEKSLLFANQTAMRALEYYDEKFDEKYPLAKLDQVALPDFEAGAMENWGLVTYRESMMLATEDSPLDLKRTVTTTITHELSHQWFGDLVTMKWWDDLWLNESFATIIEYYCADALYPEFNIWQDFYTGDCLAALRRDCLPGVQAVKQEVKTPAEIATLFDSAIVYAKGARLILMLIKIMGEKNFFKGIRYYFNKYKYHSTIGNNLWDCLQIFAEFDVKAFMQVWISQPGYPMLKKAGEEWEQQRFLIDGETDDETWPLPEVFDNMSGHYLIDLTDDEFAAKLAKFDELTTGQKVRLLMDRMLLAKAGKVPSASLLDLLWNARESSSCAVWDILASIMNDLKLFSPVESRSYHDYQKFLRQLIAGQLQTVGIEPQANDDSDIITLRNILLSIARYAEDEDVMQKLAGMYQADLSALNGELRYYILSSKLYFSEKADSSEFFGHLMDEYIKTHNPKIKADIRSTIAFARLEPNYRQVLALLEKPEIVRPQDHVFLFVHLLRNPYTHAATLDWLIEHWSYIEKLTGEKSIEDYLRYAASTIREQAEANKFFAFFDQKAEDSNLARAIQIAHAEVTNRLRLIAEQSDAMHKHLQALVAKTGANH